MKINSLFHWKKEILNKTYFVHALFILMDNLSWIKIWKNFRCIILVYGSNLRSIIAKSYHLKVHVSWKHCQWYILKNMSTLSHIKINWFYITKLPVSFVMKKIISKNTKKIQKFFLCHVIQASGRVRIWYTNPRWTFRYNKQAAKLIVGSNS